jgi:hypothetical protein
VTDADNRPKLEEDCLVLFPSVQRSLDVLRTTGLWKYPQHNEWTRPIQEQLLAMGLARLEDREDGEYLVPVR